jgi:DNA-binding NtrC family response regulator
MNRPKPGLIPRPGADTSGSIRSGGSEISAGPAQRPTAAGIGYFPDNISMDDSILIIDHESDIRMHLRSILAQRGYRVETASNPKDALDAIERNHPNLVILEIRMEGQQGLGMIRQFKEIDADIEVIVLTGSATLENAVRAMRGDGAFDFLTKPLEDLSQLFRSVDQALERHRVNRQRSFLLRHLDLDRTGRPLS